MLGREPRSSQELLMTYAGILAPGTSLSAADAACGCSIEVYRRPKSHERARSVGKRRRPGRRRSWPIRRPGGEGRWVDQGRWTPCKSASSREGRIIVFIDESGLSERPTRVRTWAPKGCTPTIQYSFNWNQLSLIAGVTFWRFYFRFFRGAIKSPQLVEFLKALRAQIGPKLLVAWDGLPAHRSRYVRDYVELLDNEIVLERLPGYAPELNPVEYLFGHAKQCELVDLCVKTIDEVKRYAGRRLKSMQRRPQIIAAFWKQAELTI